MNICFGRIYCVQIYLFKYINYFIIYKLLFILIYIVGKFEEKCDANEAIWPERREDPNNNLNRLCLELFLLLL